MRGGRNWIQKVERGCGRKLPRVSRPSQGLRLAWCPAHRIHLCAHGTVSETRKEEAVVNVTIMRKEIERGLARENKLPSLESSSLSIAKSFYLLIFTFLSTKLSTTKLWKPERVVRAAESCKLFTSRNFPSRTGLKKIRRERETEFHVLSPTGGCMYKNLFVVVVFV